MAAAWSAPFVLNPIVDMLRSTSSSSGLFSNSNVKLRFWSGAGGTGSVVVTTNFSTGRWAAASGGVAPWIGPYGGVSNNTGGSFGPLILSAELFNSSSGNTYGYFTVGEAGSGADVIVNNDTPANTSTFFIDQFDLKFPLVNGSVRWNTALANRILDCLTGISATAPTLYSGGTVDVYSGTPPDVADDPPAGTLLVSFTLNSSSWNTPSGGAAPLISPLNATAGATGTASYARIVGGGSDQFVIQGEVDETASDFLLSTVNIVNAATITLNEATLVLENP